ncbi:MAG TPA: TCR/Tet family MFS transporter [Candidatus Didemnitutus sp.]|nr:TCR/Tet family MFS transporter [Candidatus Didemnitutus sp.]
MTTEPRKPAVRFIFVTLTLAIMGFGLLIPVLPKLIIQFQGDDVTRGSHAYGALVGIYALMQFIGSPILGSLSDRFGRRRIILIATAGSAIDYTIMAVAPTLWWLFIARTIAGFTAGIFATANAYIVDVTPPEKRASAFGLLGAAFAIGFVIGPFLGGLLGKIDIHLPFWFSAGCAAVNFLWGFFVLPESLSSDHRREFSWSRANPIGALLALKRFPAVLGLVESFFFLMLAQMMMYSLWALYTSHRFGWGTDHVGFSLMVAGVLMGIVQGGLVKKVVPKLGETRAALIGFTVSCLTYIGYGFAGSTWMMYAVMVFGSLAGIAGPSMQAYITKHVPANEQGAVQGVFSGLQSLAGIPGPIIGTYIFGWSVLPGHPAWMEGLAFFAAAAFVVIAIVLAVRAFSQYAPEQPAQAGA